jgi:hypothetical protein
LTIEQIPQLGGKTGTRARSASLGDTLSFVNIPEIPFKKPLVNFYFKRPDEIFVPDLVRILIKHDESIGCATIRPNELADSG